MLRAITYTTMKGPAGVRQDVGRHRDERRAERSERRLRERLVQRPYLPLRVRDERHRMLKHTTKNMKHRTQSTYYICNAPYETRTQSTYICNTETQKYKTQEHKNTRTQNTKTHKHNTQKHKNTQHKHKTWKHGTQSTYMQHKQHKNTKIRNTINETRGTKTQKHKT